MNECPYCNKRFSDKYNINRHIKSSARCIKARGIIKIPVDGPVNFSCPCGYFTTRKDNLSTHQTACACPKMVRTLNSYKRTVTDQANTITHLEKALKKRDRAIIDLKDQVKLLMSRPLTVNNQTTNNNGPTYNMSYYKQHIQDNFESITQPFLQGVMNKITLDDISYGGSGLAKFVKKHLDHQHLLMLDQARRKGAYKDSNGQVVVDAKLRTLLRMIGEAAYPPAKKIFIDWNTDNPDSFSDTGKSKVLTNLLGSTAWLNRVGQGKTHEDDSEILSSFVDELASGYTKEALHNHLDREVSPPIIEIDDDPSDSGCEGGDNETDVSSDWPDIDEEPDSDEEYIETASITSSQFVIERKNYDSKGDYR
jgi:hypothetical protein